MKQSDNDLFPGGSFHGLDDVDASLSETMPSSEYQPGTGYVNPANLMLDAALHATPGTAFVNPQDTMLNPAPRPVADAYNASASTSGSNGPNGSRPQYSGNSSFQITNDFTATASLSRAQPAATASQPTTSTQDYNGYGQANKENEYGYEFDPDFFAMFGHDLE